MLNGGQWQSSINLSLKVVQLPGLVARSSLQKSQRLVAVWVFYQQHNFSFSHAEKFQFPSLYLASHGRIRPQGGSGTHLPLQLPEFIPQISKCLFQHTCLGRHWSCLPASQHVITTQVWMCPCCYMFKPFLNKLLADLHCLQVCFSRHFLFMLSQGLTQCSWQRCFLMIHLTRETCGRHETLPSSFPKRDIQYMWNN